MPGSCQTDETKYPVSPYTMTCCVHSKLDLWYHLLMDLGTGSQQGHQSPYHSSAKAVHTLLEGHLRFLLAEQL